MVCLTIFGVNMCVLVLCSLHEVRIKGVELHCKWRLVVPSVTEPLYILPKSPSLSLSLFLSLSLSLSLLSLSSLSLSLSLSLSIYIYIYIYGILVSERRWSAHQYRQALK